MTTEHNNEEVNRKKPRWWLILIPLLLVGIAVYLMTNIDNGKKDTEDKIPKKPAEEIIVDNDAPKIEEAKKVSILDFGAKPDDGNDDTNAIEQAISEAKKEALIVEFPKGTYDTNRTIEVSDIKGLHIKGDNAVIRPKNPMTNPPEFYAFRLNGTADDLIEMEIEGLTIDGSKNPQDLYFKMKKVDDFYKTPMTKGIAIQNTKELKIHDMKYEHMYGGYAIFASEYRNVDIHDINLEDVGGDDITDSFGMAIYLSGHKDSAIVNIDKVISHAKKSPRSKEYMGWIGVVYENGSIQDKDESKWLKDHDTTINVTNSKFIDYETTFHVESAYGNVYFNVDDVETRAKNYFVAAGVNGEMKERSNNVKIDLLPFGRNDIVHGIYYTEKMKPEKYAFDMYNSVVNNIEIDGKLTPITGVYGNNTTATFHNTTFNNASGMMVLNGTGIFKDSVINLSKDANKNKLSDFSEKEQKMDLGNSVINDYGKSTAAKAGAVPDKVFGYGKKIEEPKKPLTPAELGREATVKEK